jgi:hypothetical protein
MIYWSLALFVQGFFVETIFQIPINLVIANDSAATSSPAVCVFQVFTCLFAL